MVRCSHQEANEGKDAGGRRDRIRHGWGTWPVSSRGQVKEVMNICGIATSTGVKVARGSQ